MIIHCFRFCVPNSVFIILAFFASARVKADAVAACDSVEAIVETYANAPQAVNLRGPYLSQILGSLIEVRGESYIIPGLYDAVNALNIGRSLGLAEIPAEQRVRSIMHRELEELFDAVRDDPQMRRRIAAQLSENVREYLTKVFGMTREELISSTQQGDHRLADDTWIRFGDNYRVRNFVTGIARVYAEFRWIE